MAVFKSAGWFDMIVATAPTLASTLKVFFMKLLR